MGEFEKGSGEADISQIVVLVRLDVSSLPPPNRSSGSSPLSFCFALIDYAIQEITLSYTLPRIVMIVF